MNKRLTLAKATENNNSVSTRQKPRVSFRSANKVMYISLMALLPLVMGAQEPVNPQQRVVTLQQSVDIAFKNNLNIRASGYEIDLQTALRSGTRNLDKTTFIINQGQINSIAYDDYLSITQRIEFPTVYKNQARLADARIERSKQNLALRQAELRRNVKEVYYRLVYLKLRRALLITQDTLYNNLVKASTLRYKTGESTLLEKTTSETQSLEIKNNIVQTDADISISRQQLQTLLQIAEPVSVPDTATLKKEVNLFIDSATLTGSPYLRVFQQQIEVNKRETDVQKSKRLPDFLFGYFNQSYKGFMNVNGTERKFSGSTRFQGFQVGVAIPILPSDFKARIAASKINEQIATTNYQYQQVELQSRMQGLVFSYQKYKSSVSYYETSALPQADLIISNAEKAFRAGEIPYIQFQQSLALALKIKTDYVEALNQLNGTILLIENILGN